MRMSSAFGYETPIEGETNDWITPKWVFEKFDSLCDSMYFDLDPCSSLTQPWLAARKAYTIEQDGLKNEWWGKVWLNPPYGQNIGVWMKKMAEHGSGIALIFARTETEAWQKWIWPYANGFLFVKGRIVFYYPDGTPALNKKGVISPAGAPSVFLSWGEECTNDLEYLCKSGSIEGAFLRR